MEFLSSAAPPNFQFQQTPIPSRLSPCTLSISSLHRQLPCIGGVSFALKTGSDGGKLRSHESYDLDLVQKPIISPQANTNDEQAKAPDKLRGRDDDEEEEVDVGGEREEEDGRYRGVRERERTWVDWEDKILEDTVPLVGFVRMILHSGRYACGERLTPEHEKTILEKVLAYHPECEEKIGCGVDYITIGYHPEFGDSRCLFIVRKDGEMVDFSYWKCMKGLIRKNYPLYADSFILRHFRRRRRYN